MENNEMLNDVLNPKQYKYEMSEKLFLDIWTEWGSPSEIINGEEIHKFINQLIESSNGLFILDHFSHINFDHVKKVEYNKPFLKIFWKDFNKLREKNLKQEITQDELMTWSFNGYSTYIYMLLNVNKIKFIGINNHLFILFLTNFIPQKLGEKYLISREDELIDMANYKKLLYKQYTFFEGDKEKLVKHECFVNNLPYYSCLIQPKENNQSTGYSQRLLLVETLKEVAERMNKVKETLEETNEYEYDELYSIGNRIRRILEYCLKFLCIYKDIDLKIDDKYGYITLKDLKKSISSNYKDIKFEQKLVNIANELSHDSGIIFEKEDIFEFWVDTKDLIEGVYRIIFAEHPS